MTRGFIVCLSLVLLVSSPSSAGDLSGLYVNNAATFVEYMDITDSNGTIGGTFTHVALNAASSEGVTRHLYNVRGVSNGNRASLEIFDGPNVTLSGSSFRLNLTWTWSSLHATFTTASGQIGQADYRRADAATINSSIASLTSRGQREHQVYAAQQAQQQYLSQRAEARQRFTRDLADAQQSLANTRQRRPDLTQAVGVAQAEVEKAAGEKRQAQTNYEAALAIAKQALSDAETAIRAANTNAEQQAAFRQQSAAFALEREAFAAERAVFSADRLVSTATLHLDIARGHLADSDARIKELMERVGRDKSALSRL